MTTHLRADAPTFVPQFSIQPSASNTTPVRSRKKTTTAQFLKSKKKPTRKNDAQKYKETQSNGTQRRIQRNGTIKTNEQAVTKRRSRNTRQKNSCRQDSQDLGVLKETLDSKSEEIFGNAVFPALQSKSKPANFQQSGISSVWDDKPDMLVLSEELSTDAVKHTQKDDLFIENDASNCNFSRLTVLRKSKADQDSYQDSKIVKDDVLSAVEETLLPNVQTWRQATKIDIQKLRNRWWAVVKNKPPPDTVIERTDAENSEHTSSIENAPVCIRPKDQFVDDESVDSSYFKVDDPIYEAVRRNDEDALRSLLKSSCLEAVDHQDTVRHNPSPLQLAVDLERPSIVQILVSAARKGATFLRDNPGFPPALLVAVERGCEEILHIVLNSSFGNGPYFTSTRDADGNNVFHACCKSSVSSSVLRLLITVPNAAGFVKLLTSTNSLGQNAAHVVCQQNKAEFLDILLSSTSSLGGSFALFSKVLSMQDSIGQTPLLTAVANGSSDCVMSLLMWRGNNHQNLIPKKMDVPNAGSSPCSLAWAVKAQDLDMVLLLLEFSDSGGSGYDLTGALQVAVLMRQQNSNPNSSEEDLLTILRILVEAGANPCIFVEEPFPHWVAQHVCYSGLSGSGRCALVMSAEARDAETIDVLLKAYDFYLSRQRSKRRKDPVLAQQPESFFAGIEAKERSERKVALRVSLVTSLVAFLPGHFLLEQRSDATSSLLALYQGGAKLGLIGLRLLQACLKENSLRFLEDGALVDSAPMTLRYRATYSHPLGHEVGSNDMQFWSRMLLKKPWVLEFERNSGCAWIRSMEEVEKDRPCNSSTDFIITSEDGQRFETHSRIICEKSEKLAAAFRFSKMSSLKEELGLVETSVSLGGEYLSFLLYHMYHGSLPTTAATESALLSSETLLELLLIGEEFMCPTLIQECELRLILGPCVSRQCFCPSCSLLRQPSNECVMCTIGGKGSLVTNQCNIGPEEALDALVLAQHIGHSTSETNPQQYSLDMDVLVGDTGPESATNKGIQLQCMEALRLVSAFVILDNFLAVLSSEAFLSQTQEDEQATRTLLEMCLGELMSLSNLSGLNLNFKSKYRGLVPL